LHATSEKFLTRNRKFNPQNLFFSILRLATSTNEEGFHHALQQTWNDHDFEIKNVPSKSSLSEVRDKVSFEFFKDIFQEDLSKREEKRKTFRGFHIYAVDGDDLNLPASPAILDSGYRGYPYAKKFETHYPKMYTVIAYDILNGLVRNFSHSNKYREYRSAVDMVKTFEKNSITIYDRLYCGHPLFKEHITNGSYFIVRAKDNGVTSSRALKGFYSSGKSDMWVSWYRHLANGQDEARVRLVKIKSPKTGKEIVFATNLEKHLFSKKEIYELYKKRWEIETTFRDLTSTMKQGQWHSKKINGILQEIYALFWFVNNVKSQMNAFQEPDSPLMHGKYKKSNFKLCANLVIRNLNLFISQRFKELLELLEFWFFRALESRKHYARSYPRIIKGKERKHPAHSKVPRRPAC
jgi:IS4 transposase